MRDNDRGKRDRSSGFTLRPTTKITSPMGLTLINTHYTRLHDEEPRLILIPITTPRVNATTGTFVGSKASEWDAIADFYANLYPAIQRYGRMSNLDLDAADVGADVEVNWLETWLLAALKVRYLCSLHELAEKLKDPVYMDFTQFVFARRARRQRMLDRLASYPVPPIFRVWIDYLMQPVAVAQNGPFILGAPQAHTRAIRDVSSTADVDAILDVIETDLDGLEDSADDIKFLNALQAFRPTWSRPWPHVGPVIDPERVLMWRTRALRNTNGLTDRQNPNQEDTGWGNGERIVLFTHGNPHPFQFTGLVPAISWEFDDKGSGNAAYGSCQLIGNSADDADGPSEIDIVSGRATSTVTNVPFDYAQAVTNIGTKVWDHFIFSERTFSDDPSDYFFEGTFENIQTYEMTLEDIAVETRRLVLSDWGMNL